MKHTGQGIACHSLLMHELLELQHTFVKYLFVHVHRTEQQLLRTFPGVDYMLAVQAVRYAIL